VPVETVNNVTFENVSERLAKTQQWLSVAADNNFSIQLFMARTSDADKVEAFLRNAPETLDFTKIYIYETDVNGRSWYSVLYNEFITQDEAIEKLDTLPASLKASDPYLRRISALKKDVAR
jgi:septal ring-binding cell division protein DamX